MSRGNTTRMDYVVKEGDNLCKIAKQQYNITNDGEAYKKALQIAEENGLKDPNLIFTGNTLKLANLESPANEDSLNKNKSVDEAEDEFLNKYTEYQAKSKSFAIDAYNKSVPENEKLPSEVSFNPQTDSNVAIVDPGVFKLDTKDKIAGYKEAMLNFASKEITSSDTSKNGAVEFNEFYAYNNRIYQETYSSQENTDTSSLKVIFEALDINGDNELSKEEIANGYIMQDASSQYKDGDIKALNAQGEVTRAYDGVIDVRTTPRLDLLEENYNIFFPKK